MKDKKEKNDGPQSPHEQSESVKTVENKPSSNFFVRMMQPVFNWFKKEVKNEKNKTSHLEVYNEISPLNIDPNTLATKKAASIASDSLSSKNQFQKYSKLSVAVEAARANFLNSYSSQVSSMSPVSSAMSDNTLEQSSSSKLSPLKTKLKLPEV